MPDGRPPNVDCWDRETDWRAPHVIPVVPLLLAAFAIDTTNLTTTAAASLLAAPVLLAAAGIRLTTRAGPRWETRYRAG